MRRMVMNKMDKTIIKMNRKKMKMPSKILRLRLMTMTSRMTMTIFKNSSACSCSSCAREEDALKDQGMEEDP